MNTGTRLLGFLAIVSLSIGAQQALAMPAKFASSPDSGLDFMISSIQSAQRELFINIYEFENPKVMNAVIERINSGLVVKILVEGEPVGGIKPRHRKILVELKAAMVRASRAGSQLLLMKRKTSQSDRRFVFDHAKYMVIDGTDVYVSSDNFSNTSAVDSRFAGDRGWHVLLENPTLAQDMKRMFLSDISLSPGDVLDLLRYNIPASEGTDGQIKPFKPRTLTPLQIRSGQVASVKMFVSPNSLPGLTSVIRSARQHLELGFLSLPKSWKNEQGKQIENPIVTELIQAAKRGVKVRVLLNDSKAFIKDGEKPDPAAKDGNRETVCYLLQLASTQRLDLKARIIDLDETQIAYIHNKGILVDDRRAMVSSINGTQNSVMNNREVAVVLESPEAADYYGETYERDWSLSSDMDPKLCWKQR